MRGKCGRIRARMREDYGLDQGGGSGYEKYLGGKSDRFWSELPIGYGQKRERSVNDESQDFGLCNWMVKPFTELWDPGGGRGPGLSRVKIASLAWEC